MGICVPVLRLELTTPRSRVGRLYHWATEATYEKISIQELSQCQSDRHLQDGQFMQFRLSIQSCCFMLFVQYFQLYIIDMKWSRSKNLLPSPVPLFSINSISPDMIHKHRYIWQQNQHLYLIHANTNPYSTCCARPWEKHAKRGRERNSCSWIRTLKRRGVNLRKIWIYYVSNCLIIE